MLRAAFQNEPSLDFQLPEARAAMKAALASVGAQLGGCHPLLIGGERRETGRWITSTNPGNLDQVVGEVAKAGPTEVEAAVEAASCAFQQWRRMSVTGRAS